MKRDQNKEWRDFHFLNCWQSFITKNKSDSQVSSCQVARPNDKNDKKVLKILSWTEIGTVLFLSACTDELFLQQT